MTESPDKSRSPGSADLDAKLQAEIEAALGDMSIEDMLDLADRPRSTARDQPLELKTGAIVAIHRGDVFVEFGPKSQGICPLNQFETPPTVGEKLPFFIDRFDAKDGILILSREGAVPKAAYDSMAEGQVNEPRCTGTNKGGLEMELPQHKS